MALVIAYLLSATFVLALCIEAAVIKLQDIPVKDGLTLKMVLKEDPHNKGSSVASIRLEIENDKSEEEKDDLFTKLVEKYVKPANDIVPDFGSRAGMVNGKCPVGRVRRGHLCV